MKNIFSKLLFACVAFSLLHGCALDNEIYDEINPEIFPKSAEDVDALVTVPITYSIQINTMAYLR